MKKHESLNDYFQPGVLDPQSPIFIELAKDPLWWKMIREDRDLYINIRKNNRISVYYKGASVMSLTYNRRSQIQAEIHNNFLGYNKIIADKLGVDYGNIILPPEEIVCRLDMIKSRIVLDNKYKPGSEKDIQSNIFLSGNYFDTEFQVQLDNGIDVKIDLISLTDDNLIQFTELKRVIDTRLKSTNPNDSEILVQMKSYEKFIHDVSTLMDGDNLLIVNYYNTVLTILDNINALPNHLHGKVIKGLSKYVDLYIDGSSYTKKDRGKRERLESIKVILDTHNIVSNINDVICRYNQLS